jgi:hypothetical protein
MTQQKKLSLVPPIQKQPTPEEFIRQATIPPVVTDDKAYPWENPRVRADVIKAVNLRLSEPYILKLQYLAEKTHKSQQELIRECLLPWLDEEVIKY